MNLNLFLSALRARFGVFALVLGVTVLAAIVVSLVMPKTYKATVSLLVDPGREQQSLSTADSFAPPRERLGYMQTQMGIITSEKVARKVVQDLKLADNPKVRESFEEANFAGSIEDWLIAALIEQLKVETSQSNIISVTFAAEDPRMASLVANAFAKTYIDTVLELRVEPTKRNAVWFDEQLKVLRANLEEAQSRLSAYQKQHGIVSADERLDVESTRLAELSAQVLRVQDTTLDWKSREQQARDAVRTGSLAGLPDVLNNPYIQRLNADLLAGEARLQEMSAQYGPNYPAYARQVADNKALRGRLNTEMQKVVQGLENARKQSQQREAELRGKMAAQHTRLLEGKQGRNELVVLTRNVETAQRTYETAMQRFVVSQVESRASQTNVGILDVAAVPTKPAQPKMGLNIALSLVVGTMLGLGLATLIEMFDRRVRSGYDLANDYNVPMLAALNVEQPVVHPLLDRPLGSGMRALPKPA
jgi:succinoglycan biosynthesis transport protein ExoP